MKTTAFVTGKRYEHNRYGAVTLIEEYPSFGVWYAKPDNKKATLVSKDRLGRCLPTAEEKLKLIEEPARRAIRQLRILADDTTLGICDEGQCTLSNLALWLEGVLDENPGYVS